MGYGSAAHTMLQISIGQKDKEALIVWFQHATQEILTVTYWFDPVAYPKPYRVTVRFSGKKQGDQ